MRFCAFLAGVVAALTLAQSGRPVTGGVPLLNDVYVEGSAQLGSTGPFGQGAIFAPVLSNDTNLLFVEYRGIAGDDSEWIRSLGVGFRHQTDSAWIVGGYAFLDAHRQASEVQDSQVMFGVEMLSVEWDFRINAYLPNDGSSRLSGRGVLSNGTVVVDTVEEAAYYGSDVEAGTLMAEWLEGRLELRGYAGAFWFDQRLEGYDAAIGPRVRTELRLYDLPWLGNGSRLVATGQYEWDQIRGSQGNLLINLRVPLRFRKSRALDRYERRMFNPIARHPGVLVNSTRRREQATFVDGREIQAAAIFDASTPSAATQIAALGVNSLAMLDGIAGPIRTGTIKMQAGQAIVGSGTGLYVYGRDTGVRAVLPVPGKRPLLDYRDLHHTIIELPRSHGAVIGLDLIGGTNGIVGGRALPGALPVPLNINARTASAHVSPARTIISGNRIAVVERHLMLSGPEGNGILLDNSTILATIGPVVINRNRFDDNHLGVLVVGDFEGAISENYISGNTQKGLQIDGDVLGNVWDNHVSENGDIGIDILGTLTGDLRENTSVDNLAGGVRVRGDVIGDIDGNESSRNDGTGFRIEGRVDGSVIANRAEENHDYGFALVERVTGAVADNTASNNRFGGIVAADVLGGITGNLLDGNGTRGHHDYGLSVHGTVEGGIVDNTFINNRGPGVLLHLAFRDDSPLRQDVIFRDNELSGNNQGETEFMAGLMNGELGPVKVGLQNNISRNGITTPGVFHFQALSGVHLRDDGGNTGTIGN